MLNTSFNLHGDAIVESPKDAVDTFLRSEIDVLLFDNVAISPNVLKNLDKDSVPKFINNLIEEAQNKIDIYALFALALLVFSLWVLFF